MEKVKLSVTDESLTKKDPMSLAKERKTQIQIVVGVLFFVFVLIVVGIASWFILKSNNKETATSNGTLALNPTSNTSQAGVLVKGAPSPMPKPLLPGPHIFSVSSKNAIIVVKELYISSLATKIGDPQTFRLTLKDSKGAVNSVSINLITDKKSEIHALTLKSGTGADGIWEGTWTTNDTHDYIYQAKTIIKDGSGNKFSFMPSFR